MHAEVSAELVQARTPHVDPSSAYVLNTEDSSTLLCLATGFEPHPFATPQFADVSRAVLSAAVSTSLDAEPRRVLDNVFTRAQKALEGAQMLADESDDFVAPPAACLLAVLIRDHTATIAWLGRHEARQVRDKRVIAKTPGHTVANSPEHANRFQNEPGSRNPFSKFIIRSVGPEREPDFASWQVEPGDSLLLLTGPVLEVTTQDDITSYASGERTLSALLNGLDERASGAGVLELRLN